VWLRETLAAHAGGGTIEVSCGECVACCSSSHFVHIRPDDRRTLARVPRVLLVPAPGAPASHVVMGYDERGRCPMLHGGRCSIYEDRPLTCRTYDCRVFAAAGIDADRPAVTRRVRGWAFELSAEEDRRALAAVRAAAAFLRRHPECFTGGAQADNPAHVALLALEAHEVFLGRDDASARRTGCRPSGGEPTTDELVAAVIAAGERAAGRR